VKVRDWHFLRFAGAAPTYDMAKAQRLNHRPDPTAGAEMPADSPDRPSNITRSMGEFRPPEAQAAADPDLPDAILERGKQAAPSDLPDAILERGRQGAPQPGNAPETASGRIVTDTA